VTGWPIPAIFVMIPFALGYATMRVAESRGCQPGEKPLWYLLGLLFPVVGLVLAALVAGPSSGPPPPPPLLPDPPRTP